MPKPSLPRRFHLQRHHDVSGVSGTGTVALGVLWPDGTASVRWLGDRPSIVFWDSMADAEAVHGHGGATEIVWDDEPAVHRHRAKGTNAEDCPACAGTNPPYPFLCPGPDDEQPAVPAQRSAGTPCSQPDPCEDGELCDVHEEEQAHAAGHHGYCGVTCEVAMPSEQMRNFILARGYPGTAGALDELLRRAAAQGAP